MIVPLVIAMIIPWTLYYSPSSTFHYDQRFGTVQIALYIAGGAIVEELFWRGFLQEALLQVVPHYRGAIAVTFVAVAWSAGHFVLGDYGLPEALPLSLCSVVLVVPFGNVTAIY